MNLKDLQAYTAIKYTHKLVNSDSSHYFKHYLLQNRSNKNRQNMKHGPHRPCIGRANTTQSTYLYSIVNEYNTLPEALTKIGKHTTFKKWLKNFYNNRKVKIPQKETQIKYQENQVGISRTLDHHSKSGPEILFYKKERKTPQKIGV